MPSFSSVIHQPGKKFAPRAAPRRNVLRSTPLTATSSAQSTPGPETPVAGTHSADETALRKNPASLGCPAATGTPPVNGIATSSVRSDTSTPATSIEPPTIEPTVAPQKEPRRIHEIPQAIPPNKDNLNEQLQATTSTLSIPPQVPVKPKATGVKSVKRKTAPSHYPTVIPANVTLLALPYLPDNDHQLSAAQESPRKRRKATPRAVSPVAPPQGIPNIGDGAPSEAESTTSRQMRRDDRPTDELLQDATSQAAAVSTLANSIDGGPRPSQQRRRQTKPSRASAPIAVLDPDADGESATANLPKPANRKQRKKKTVEALVDEIVADAVQGKRRKGRKQPEGDEDHEIEPEKVTMGELVNDRGLGQKSSNEKRMENVDWNEVKARRKQDALEKQKRQAAAKEERQTGRARKEDAAKDMKMVPQLRIGPDGQLILDQDSVTQSRSAPALTAAEDPDAVVIEDEDVTKRVNQRTVGRQPRLYTKPMARWDELQTEKFYKGLRMFGTDFMMISQMFPDMERRHIKLKYVREEKTNLARIQKNLAPENKEEVDLGEFEEMVGQEFGDPEELQREMEADERKMREEDEKRREEERRGEHPAEDANAAAESEGDGEGDAEGREGAAEPGEQGAPARTGRFDSIADRIVAEAVAPRAKKQGQQPKKRGPAAGKKKDAGAGKKGKKDKRQQPFEGTEEVLGVVEEVPR